MQVNMGLHNNIMITNIGLCLVFEIAEQAKHGNNLWGAVCKAAHAENKSNILSHLASNNV